MGKVRFSQYFGSNANSIPWIFFVILCIFRVINFSFWINFRVQPSTCKPRLRNDHHFICILMQSPRYTSWCSTFCWTYINRSPNARGTFCANTFSHYIFTARVSHAVFVSIKFLVKFRVEMFWKLHRVDEIVCREKYFRSDNNLIENLLGY